MMSTILALHSTTSCLPRLRTSSDNSVGSLCLQDYLLLYCHVTSFLHLPMILLHVSTYYPALYVPCLPPLCQTNRFAAKAANLFVFLCYEEAPVAIRQHQILFPVMHLRIRNNICNFHFAEKLKGRPFRRVLLVKVSRIVGCCSLH